MQSESSQAATKETKMQRRNEDTKETTNACNKKESKLGKK